MNRTFSETKLEALLSGLDTAKTPRVYARQPVHTVYCGASRFEADASRRIGEAALRSIDSYAPDFVSFARAMWLTGADTLPRYDDLAQELEFELIENPENVKSKNYAAWFAWTIYQRTIEKLKREPVEELQIDLIGPENEGAAIAAADHLAQAFLDGAAPPFTSVRLPSMEPRNARILDIFLTALIDRTGGKLPGNFSVTITNVSQDEDAGALDTLLSEFEKLHTLQPGSVKVALTVHAPRSIIDDGGRIVLGALANAAGGRCISVHLDGDSFLNGLNIPAVHRHPRHEACNFARQIMHLVLSPMNIGLSDSIVPSTALFHGADIQTVHRAWREHFNGVTHSLIGGFYQGLDPDLRLLPARYAAVYSFFLQAGDKQGKRLREFTSRAAAATGLEDENSAQATLNFFYRALDCGALFEYEVLEATGLNAEELKNGSFAEIMKRRQYKAAAS
jgi:hypothetical protein